MNEQLVNDCPFCKIIRGEAAAQMVAAWPDAIAFVPLDPVTPGHVLVVPTVHVSDFIVERDATAAVMNRAAILADTLPALDWNLITSAGPAATQTVYHLHVHLVPRRRGDGLHLPWTGQRHNAAGMTEYRDQFIEEYPMRPFPPAPEAGDA